MKKEIISEVEYKVFCEDFFKEKTLGDNLGCYVKNLTVKEFESFQEKTMTKYYQKKYKIINDFVKNIREGFDIFNDNEGKDPLKKEENKKIYRAYEDIFHNVFYENFDNVKEVVEKIKLLKEYKEKKRKEDELNIVFNGKKT